MPNGQPAQLANLRPFSKGHRINGRADGAKHKALRCAKLNSPEAVEFNLAVMRDPGEPIIARLRASENILRCAFPTQSVAQVSLADSGEQTSRRFLEIRFVDPEDANLLEAKPNGHDTFTVAFNP